MSFVRNIAADLVDKRLWPLAAMLVLALVAVPVLLGKSAPSTQGGPPVAPPVQGPLSGLLAATTTPGGGPIGGSARDPFRQQHLPKPLVASASGIGPATAGAASAEAGGGSGAGGSTDSGSGGSGSGSGGGSTTAGPVTTLRVRFGPSDSSRPVRNLVDGAPLPNASLPLLVYLGLKGNSAVFLVSSDAQPQGDGKCLPTKAICSELHLKPGQTQFFDVTGPGGTVQYELDVVGIVRP
jgi:hypothetical protein